MDPLAPSITFFDKDTGKGRVTYIGSLNPDQLFYPTPGLWFTNQGPEMIVKLAEIYDQDPYPTAARMEELAKQFNAPDQGKIESFFNNMRLKHQEAFQ